VILEQFGQVCDHAFLLRAVETEKEGIVDGQDAEEFALGNTIQISAPWLVYVLYYLVLLVRGSKDRSTREQDREQGK
jgi:hypothetical protein